MLDVVKVNAAKKIRKQEKDNKAVKTYRKAKEAADAIFAVKVPEKWGVADYKVILKLLKRPGDCPILMLKKDLVALYPL